MFAFKAAKDISRSVIVEKYIMGDDYRLLVINYKLVAAAKRTPAHIIGDGVSTIQQLVDEVNKDPRRGYGHENVLTQIHFDKMTDEILANKNLTKESILTKGEKIKLKRYRQLKHRRHCHRCNGYRASLQCWMAERIAKIVGLDICGLI